MNMNEYEHTKWDNNFNIAIKLCIVAGILNFLFAIIVFVFNINHLYITALGTKLIFSEFMINLIITILILIFLSIASFVFLFIYNQSNLVGFIGFILCGFVCLFALFIEWKVVLLQLILYSISIFIMSKDNFMSTTRHL